jgi:hypothetical protein
MATPIVIVSYDGYDGLAYIPLSEFPESLHTYIQHDEYDPNEVKCDRANVDSLFFKPTLDPTLMFNDLHKLLRMVIRIDEYSNVTANCRAVEEFERRGFTFTRTPSDGSEIYVSVKHPEGSLFKRYWDVIPDYPVKIFAALSV